MCSEQNCGCAASKLDILRADTPELYNSDNSVKEDEDIDDGASDTSSIQFLVASPQKVPKEWKKAFASSTPALKGKTSGKESDSPQAAAILIHNSPDDREERMSSIYYTRKYRDTANLVPSQIRSKRTVIFVKNGVKAPLSPSPNALQSYPDTDTSMESTTAALTPPKLSYAIPARRDEQLLPPADKRRTLSDDDVKLPQDYSLRPEAPPTSVLPMRSRLPASNNKTVVLKLTNLPWTATNAQVMAWLGSDIKTSMLPPELQVVSMHILCDR